MITARDRDFHLIYGRVKRAHELKLHGPSRRPAPRTTPQPLKSRPANQRVVVKTYYTTPDKLGAHIKYLQREGAGRDGAPAELFTSEDRTHNVQDAIQKEAYRNEERFFKIILSPEHGDRLDNAKNYDMEKYTKEFMADLEKETGRTYKWASAVHYNTDNPHAHIVIRGVDSNEREVQFSQNMIQHRMRGIASEIATRELGPRTEFDIAQQRQKEITQDRFTSLDRSIKAHATPRLDSQNFPYAYAVTTKDPYEAERLYHLANLNLAHPTRGPKGGGVSYDLNPTWERDLKNISQREDILKNVYGKERTNDAENFILYRKNWTIEGIVEKKGLADERNDRPYVMVRTSKGSLYYYSSDALHDVHKGDRIQIDQNKVENLSPHKDQTRPSDKSERFHFTGDRESPRASQGGSEEKTAQYREFRGVKIYTNEDITYLGARVIDGTVEAKGAFGRGEEYALIRSKDGKLYIESSDTRPEVKSLNVGDSVHADRNTIKNLSREQGESPTPPRGDPRRGRAPGDER